MTPQHPEREIERATIRRQALEEVLAIIRAHPKREAHMVRAGLIEAAIVVQSLLAADPREAMESGKVEYTGHPELGTPDPDHPLYRKPAPELTPLTDDYGPLPEPEPAKTYHDGVRDALAARPLTVPDADDPWHRGVHAGVETYFAAISALLPQPKDEAEEIVERWEDYAEEQTGLVPVREMQVGAASMLRWLLSQGWRAPNDR